MWAKVKVNDYADRLPTARNIFASRDNLLQSCAMAVGLSRNRLVDELTDWLEMASDLDLSALVDRAAIADFMATLLLDTYTVAARDPNRVSDKFGAAATLQVLRIAAAHDTFSYRDLVEFGGYNEASASSVISRLYGRGWLARMRPGIYYLSENGRRALADLCRKGG